MGRRVRRAYNAEVRRAVIPVVAGTRPTARPPSVLDLHIPHGGAQQPKRKTGGRAVGVPNKPRPWLAPPIVIAAIPDVLPRWFVLQSHPSAERLAAHELTRSGFRCYLPLIADRKRDPVVRSLWHRVLSIRFPSYCFFELNAGDPWVPVLHAAGVRKILLTGRGKPAPVPVGEVARHMEDDNRLCDLTHSLLPSFSAGAMVIIEAGALAGHGGVVANCNGLVTTVEVELFSRPMQVRVSRGDVSLVA